MPDGPLLEFRLAVHSHLKPNPQHEHFWLASLVLDTAVSGDLYQQRKHFGWERVKVVHV